MKIRNIGMGLALALALTVYGQTPAHSAPAPAAAHHGAAAGHGVKPTAFVVSFKVKPGKNAAFVKVFKAMQAKMRAREPGCLYYDLYLSGHDPQTYVLIEHYKSPAAVATHGKSQEGQQLIAGLKGLLDGPPKAMRLKLVSPGGIRGG
ncbi:MAG: putative quinol monooxygenase [Sciscionella sp.]